MNALLTEYNEEQVLKDLSQEFYEDGVADGEMKTKIVQVCKKLRKHKECSMIASELEEDEAYIQSIVDAAQKYAPDYDVEQIYQELNK